MLVSRAAETLIHQTPLVGMCIGKTVGRIRHEYLPALCTGVVLSCNKSPQSYGFNKTVTNSQLCRSEDQHSVARLSAQETARLKWKVLGGLSPHLGALGRNQCASSFSLWAKSRSLRLRADVLLPCWLSVEGPLSGRPLLSPWMGIQYYQPATMQWVSPVLQISDFHLCSWRKLLLKQFVWGDQVHVDISLS